MVSRFCALVSVSRPGGFGVMGSIAGNSAADRDVSVNFVVPTAVGHIRKAVARQAGQQFALDARHQARALHRPARCRAAPGWRRRGSWHRRLRREAMPPTPTSVTALPSALAHLRAGLRWMARAAACRTGRRFRRHAATCSAGRAMVVLETIRPSMPLARTTAAISSSACVIQIGRDLEQQRACSRSARALRSAVSSRRVSSSLFCRPRRPGVLGEETLTVT